MRAADQLALFVREALLAGRSRPEISEALQRAGWSESEVTEALAAWEEGPFLPPVPRPRPFVSAREAFVYGVMFIALAVTTWHIVSLGFHLIDRWIPDAAGPGWFSSRNIRWSLASLIVFAPLFLYLDHRSFRATRADPAQRRSLVRRWFASVTLFLAVMALLGDLIVVIHALLNGDLTLRFAVKAGLVAGIAGIVLAYFRDVPAEVPGRADPRWPALALAALAVAAILLGMFATGGPGQGRKERRDEVRMQDLRALSAQVNCLAREAEGALPPALVTTETCPAPALRLEDPYTGNAYRYERVNADAYRLCADFETGQRERSGWRWSDYDPATGCVHFQHFHDR